MVFADAPDYARWELIGRQLLGMANSCAWWIADWLVYGESTFGDRYLEAIQRTSLSYQTLRNYAWVARQFDMARRRERLSFGHHAEVAALEAPEQDYWLRKAEKLGWSRNKLRSFVRASVRERQADKNAVELGRLINQEQTDKVGSRGDDLTSVLNHAAAPYEKVQLELTDEQISRFKAAAAQQRLELEEWAVKVLEAATDRDVANTHR